MKKTIKRDLKFNYSKHGKRKCTTLTNKNSRHAFLKRHKNFSGQKLFDTIFQVIFSGPTECFWKLPKALYSHLNFSLFFSGFTASYENIFLKLYINISLTPPPCLEETGTLSPTFLSQKKATDNKEFSHHLSKCCFVP